MSSEKDIKFLENQLQRQLEYIKEKVDSNAKGLEQHMHEEGSTWREVIDILNDIKIQTTKTNGRVTRAEEKILELESVQINKSDFVNIKRIVYGAVSMVLIAAMTAIISIIIK